MSIKSRPMSIKSRPMSIKSGLKWQKKVFTRKIKDYHHFSKVAKNNLGQHNVAMGIKKLPKMAKESFHQKN